VKRQSDSRRELFSSQSHNLHGQTSFLSALYLVISSNVWYTNRKAFGEMYNVCSVYWGGMICQSIKSRRFRWKDEWAESPKRRQLVGDY
jgi:hypothetical protein